MHLYARKGASVIASDICLVLVHTTYPARIKLASLLMQEVQVHTCAALVLLCLKLLGSQVYISMLICSAHGLCLLPSAPHCSLNGGPPLQSCSCPVCQKHMLCQ